MVKLSNFFFGVGELLSGNPDLILSPRIRHPYSISTTGAVGTVNATSNSICSLHFQSQLGLG